VCIDIPTSDFMTRLTGNNASTDGKTAVITPLQYTYRYHGVEDKLIQSGNYITYYGEQHSSQGALARRAKASPLPLSHGSRPGKKLSGNPPDSRRDARVQARKYRRCETVRRAGRGESRGR
jgi:hypothetical protein